MAALPGMTGNVIPPPQAVILLSKGGKDLFLEATVSKMEIVQK
jgi:hypothetical protein